MSDLTASQIAEWIRLRDAMLADSEFMADREADVDPRRAAVAEINALRAGYLQGQITLNELRATYQTKSASAWRSFGLQGFAGAMFLNMLVKNITDRAGMEAQFKQVLRQPTSDSDGLERLRAFQDYLGALLASGKVAKRGLAIGHARLFVTSWWHMGDTEHWPIYYPSSADALHAKGLFAWTSKDRVAIYRDFRDAFLKLMAELGLTAWQMEDLCVWVMREAQKPLSPDSVELPARVPSVPADAPIAPAVLANVNTIQPATVKQERDHTHIQYLLATIGQKFGYKVWIAPNDRKATWEGHVLGTLSIDQLPPLSGVSEKSRRMIALIDVVWIKNATVVAAFEVEGTTSIFSGLLRLSDLSLALEGFNFPLFIAVPDARKKDVEDQLKRLTFQTLGLHQDCWYFTFEELIAESPHLLRYGQDREALKQLGVQVPSVNFEND